MDINLNISFSQALFTSIIILFLFHKLRNWFQTKSSAPKLPPGPRKLPIIGNIHNLAGAMPHHRLAELANTYGPLMHLKLGEKSMVVVSSAEAAKEIMKVHDVNFASRPYTLAGEIFVYNFKDIAQIPYGEYWRQARKIFSLELLSSKRVQSFRALREEVVTKMVAEIAASAETGTAVNLSDKLFMFSHGLISGAAFGRKDKYGIRFKEIIRRLVELAGGFSVADIFPSLKFLQVMSGVRPGLEKLAKEADEVLEDMLREHRTARANKDFQLTGEDEEKDLVDVLLDLQQEQSNKDFQLTDDSIKALLEDCFLGGTETGSSTIEWIISEMLRNPRVLRKAQAEVRELHARKGGLQETDLHELTYMNQVIRENFRMHPPLPLLLPRESAENRVIFGHDIPAKTQVIVNVWAIGRDPRIWEDPDTFYPERFENNPIDFRGSDFELLPFGAGRRICPGISFGMASVEVGLANLLCHFDWKLPDGNKFEQVDMSEAFGSAVRRKTDLWLVPLPRKNL
uniref:Cytochrome P450 CYP71-3a n=1 Tax=Daphne genkwa TaxID=1477590 RepID=A0A977LFW6_9ROSI|nr:cytochrome P450 CYP71-3a [Daphne genkwa]